MGQFHQEIKSIVHTCGDRMEGERETGTSVNEWVQSDTKTIELFWSASTVHVKLWPTSQVFLYTNKPANQPIIHGAVLLETQ
jgi:hypothetical protein